MTGSAGTVRGRATLLVALVTSLVLAGVLAGAARAHDVGPNTYLNPLRITTPDGARVETFADPAVIRGTDGHYYAYATTDPLSDSDRGASGQLNFNLIPTASSADLVHWRYEGPAFAARPSYASPQAGLWAPDIQFMNGTYYLYYTVTDTTFPGGGSAIGVATAPTPTGPWTHRDSPVVEPHAADCCPGSRRAVLDPFVLQTPTRNYIFYGSYFGGISTRELSADGFTSDPLTQSQIAIPNRYEGAYVVQRNGFYYLFASATDCCRGPLTGYTVFAGRSLNPLGPYVDRLGIPLTEFRVGGSVVISMNGNRWVGTGHNSVITDNAGQDWFVYHAIDRDDPYLDPDPDDPADPDPFNINKRPMLIDRLEWIDGWPTVRAGFWASETKQRAPKITRSDPPQPALRPLRSEKPGRLLQGPSDEFDGTLEPEWSWVRPTSNFSLTDRPGYLRFPTHDGDLFEDIDNAPVLVRDAPASDFLVETKFDFHLPDDGCCHNFEQAGITLYQDDDRYVRLTQTSIWETRQTEFGKEVLAGDPQQARPRRYGNTVIGPPGLPGAATTTTWLRIVKRTDPRTRLQLYTAYSSLDGVHWERGGTWTHNLSNLKIGVISFGNGASVDLDGPHDVDFDYVRVYRTTGRGPRGTSQ